jgi:hypothetical protein
MIGAPAVAPIPGLTSSGGERAGKARVVLDPGRAARLVHLRDHRRALERQRVPGWSTRGRSLFATTVAKPSLS